MSSKITKYSTESRYSYSRVDQLTDISEKILLLRCYPFSRHPSWDPGIGPNFFFPPLPNAPYDTFLQQQTPPPAKVIFYSMNSAKLSLLARSERGVHYSPMSDPCLSLLAKSPFLSRSTACVRPQCLSLLEKSPSAGGGLRGASDVA